MEIKKEYNFNDNSPCSFLSAPDEINKPFKQIQRVVNGWVCFMAINKIVRSTGIAIINKGVIFISWFQAVLCIRCVVYSQLKFFPLDFVITTPLILTPTSNTRK